MKLEELLSCIPFYKTTENVSDLNIDKIVMDSRKVKPGDLFICISGYTVDGHDFVNQAEANGAVAIIAEKPVDSKLPVILVPDSKRALSILAVKYYDNPTGKFSLIGVTGTNGKTTVTYLLEAIFKLAKQKTGVIGTLHMKIDDETYPVINTTPDALSLQQTFDKMAKQHIEQAIMEVSSHALVQGRVHGCDYDIAVFTNLSQDHLDFHKDMDDYLRAKSLLFAQMGNHYDTEKRKYAVLNQDEPASELLKQSTAQHVITYGIDRDAQVMASDIELGATGIYFQLKTPIGNIHIKSKLMGTFNVYNMLAASAAAIVSNISLDTIQEAFEQIEGVNGRFEPVNEGQSFAVIVDYAHTPDSLENVLQTVKEFAKQRVFVVVGCGGDRDKTKRPVMAQIAVKYADKPIFTSDNPRTEDPMAILEDMTNGLDNDATYEVIADRKAAIHEALNQAADDDIIVIAGKGHETYQQIGHTKYDFDDREVARQAILAKERA
ncbi:MULTISPECIES: UDP-N-acetylmuramoyl-L-alanyl-D-glutamate--2,6-diaminopimelate ligase [unclassified Virgibacillus]|uniref:UDP-N-acetylmuramoyl-L-alanyl-D-glutamate--2, 6-diaminopimelate ligase n=1 Tax=unclassified Virgibacillus TaxID=2620237 RepID=UPI00090A76DB|nr:MULTISPECIES: UDP-N-acetylmuramoyl-L-alanyl-D-glutamate--2,6-diaminopimelate ligase [unclassified Virgibacillus]API93795.1 UDP-N-acetylmuramoyl-L-alanyl-D-glutamate--2,6-diaminopimelate ligase [Virgibacillus sp. 6R]MBS7429788.1 UDP-N-acetylmuramoyl-L-alanyl-D-glutamate--2,6-diaminopimelate ligase [Virgibacillus sp. 19R1-5]